MIEKAVVIYWSKTGNTRKVAFAIKEGLEEKKVKVECKTVAEAEEIDFFDYDLVSLGCPSYQWSPPEAMDQFLQDKFTYYRNSGKVKLKAPKRPDRNVLFLNKVKIVAEGTNLIIHVFITYKGEIRN